MDEGGGYGAGEEGSFPIGALSTLMGIRGQDELVVVVRDVKFSGAGVHDAVGQGGAYSLLLEGCEVVWEAFVEVVETIDEEVAGERMLSRGLLGG